MIAIGIDIGGTFVKFIAADKNGKILKRHKMCTCQNQSAARFLQQLAEVVNNWKKELKTKNTVIGIGMPGDTDNKKGILRWAPNIPWGNLKVKETLAKKTGCKCFVSNDANMAAWGVLAKELKFKYKDIIVITMGTGIGGGIITDGRLLQGAQGSAGEVGHMKIDFSAHAPLCGCGSRGCLEAFCGASALERRGVPVKPLFDAAAKGDRAALDLWHDIGVHLGRAIANLVLLLNPQAVVLAGGVSRGAKYFMGGVNEILKQQSVKTPFKNLKILVSKTSDVGALGAALYAAAKNNEK